MPIDQTAALIAERGAMFGTLCDLEPAEWDTASLCEGWRVRDVATHAHLSVTINVPRLLVGLLTTRGDFNRFMAGYVPRLGDRAVSEILTDFGRFAATAKTPPMIKVVDQAVDVFVHHHDVAIPLGRAVPTDRSRLRWMADGMVAANRVIGSARRVRGLRFVATDIDWHYGTGPEVVGPAASLILAGCGRTAVHQHLEGDGLELLAGRS